jgi:hypothetical protein
MKRHMLIFAAISSISLVACKKDDPSPITPSPAEGFWQGSYSKTGMLGTEKMALLIKPGGSIRYYEMNFETDTAALPAIAKVNGTWILNGSDLKISYMANSKTYNASLALNAANTQLNGPWSEGAVVKGNMILNR